MTLGIIGAGLMLYGIYKFKRAKEALEAF